MPTDYMRLNQAKATTECNLQDDMYYCGSTSCNICDYDF